MTELLRPSPVWLTALVLSSSLASAGPKEDGVPAMLSFGDIDGDGLEEALSVSALGQITLLANRGEGQFTNITEACGLGGVEFATCALFTDFDGDGAVDLFLGSSSERLWRNLGGGKFAAFQSNLDHDLVDFSAWSIDTDQDGLLDLHVRTEAGDLVYRNLGEGLFEHVAITGAGMPMLPAAMAGVDVTTLDPDGTKGGVALDTAISARRRLTRWLQANRGPSAFPPTSSASSGFSGTSIGTASAAGSASSICAGTIEDQATGLCIQASSVGMLGMLYPISSDLFVDATTGFVGMGTTTPTSRLSVAGAVSSSRFISTVGTGTPPLTVSSRSVVPLLNADFVDGLHAVDFRLVATQITSGDVLDDSLTFQDLAPDSVTGSELAADAVGTAEIRNNAVTGAKVLDNSLTQADIGPGAITASELAPNSVASANIIDGSITAADLSQTGANPGQVLKWNGFFWSPESDLLGFSPWTVNGSDIGYAAGNVGVGTASPSTTLHVDGSGILATSSGATSIPAEGVGTRMMWYAGKAALRAGTVHGSAWDEGQTGVASVALNVNTIASGFASTATGENTIASGFTGTSMGFSTSADSYAGLAIGRHNIGGGSPAQWNAGDPLFELGIGSDNGNRNNAMTVLKNGNVGVGTHLPAARLDVVSDTSSPSTQALSVRGTGNDATLPDEHVMLIKQENGFFQSGLAIQSTFTVLTVPEDNFITFFSGDGTSWGSIEGNGSNGVRLGGPGSDFAEYLPMDRRDQAPEAAEVVGVSNGRIVSPGEPADRFMVITKQAIVAGNRRDESSEWESGHGLVSFIGQVPVRVRGIVRPGDFVLASESGDGTGIAVAASDIPADAMYRVVGRAWESSDDAGLKMINTAVGLDQTGLVAPALQELQRENATLRGEFEALRARGEATETTIEQLQSSIELLTRQLEAQAGAQAGPQQD